MELVDDVERAGADRSGAPVVCVHRTWRESIYDAGLSRVTRHYPLALEPRGNQDVPSVRSAKHLTLWRGKAIKQVYWAGAFTGQLRLVPVFVARTLDGLGLYAHHKAECAAKGALTERRAELRQEELGKRRVAMLRRSALEILRRRQSDGGYDGDYRVTLTPYTKLLPWAECLALEADTAPLIVLEHESIDAMMHMEWHKALMLFNQLACDVSAARTVRAQRKGSDCPSLSAEEESALAELLTGL